MKIEGKTFLDAATHLDDVMSTKWKRSLLSVGVTGTNGKTTTTTLISRLLGLVAKPVVRVSTIGGFLSDELIDLPPTHSSMIRLLHMGVTRGSRFAAIECTSLALSGGFASSWPCEIAVFTNLTRDHLDQHGTAEEYLACKAQLFMNLPRGGTAVLNAADPASEQIERVVPAGVRVWRYALAERGDTSRADLVATGLRIHTEGTECDLHASPILGVFPQKLRIRGIGAIFVENALGALLAAVAAGVPADRAVAELENTECPPGRFELVRKNPHVYIDYAHNGDGIQRAIDAAHAIVPEGGKLWAVFGGGGNRDTETRAPMGAAAATADYIVLTTGNPKDESPVVIADAIEAGIPKTSKAKVIRQLNRIRAIEQTIAAAGPKDVILICGRGHEREQYVEGRKYTYLDADIARAAPRRKKKAPSRRKK